MPGWIGSNRRRELPPNWPDIRATVLIRDGYACQHIRHDTGQRCNALARDVDHIDRHGPDETWNLQSLCAWHHLRKSGSEGGRASRDKRRAAEPKHPGIIPPTHT